MLQSAPDLGFTRLAPGRPSALGTGSEESVSSAAGRVRRDPRVLPSKVRISFGSRRASRPRLSPPAVPPSRGPGSLPFPRPSAGRDRSRPPLVLRSGLPARPRFDPHGPRSVGGAVRSVRVSLTVSGRGGARSVGAPARAGSGGDLAGPAQPGCPGRVVRQGRCGRFPVLPRSRDLGVSAVDPCSSDHTAAGSLLPVGLAAPVPRLSPRPSFVAGLSGSFCLPRGRPGDRSVPRPAMSRGRVDLRGPFSGSPDPLESAVRRRGALVLRWFSGPRRMLRTSDP
jgi:hypothetical protein